LGSGGYPVKAIIDREGKVAFVGRGYPMPGFDEALAAVVRGDHDAGQAARAQARNLNNKKAAETLLKDAAEKAKVRDYVGAVAAYRKVLAIDAGLFALPAAGLYTDMRRDAGREAANQWASALVDELLTGDDQRFAWPLSILAQAIALRPNTQDIPRGDNDPADYELALRCASRSNSLMNGKDPWRIQTLAIVHWAKGDKEEAKRWIQQAVKTGEDQNWGEDELGKIRAMRDRYSR
jgi:hypothetical protein